MALSQKHRVQLHDTLAPIVGEDAIGALLDQFPAHEFDEPATKGFVRAEIAEARTDFADFRSELRTAIGDVQAASKADIAELRTELKSDIGEVKVEIADLRTDVKTEIADLRTELRTETGRLSTRIAESEARVAESLRQQTVWFSSATVLAVSLATALSQLIR